MPNDEEFLWRPVMEGLCSYRDVKENRVDFADLWHMNELILVRAINERRATEAAQKHSEQMGKPAQLPMVGNLGNGLDTQFPKDSFDDLRWRR